MSVCGCKYKLFTYGPDGIFYLGACFNSLPSYYAAADLGKKFMMLGILGKVIRVIDFFLTTDCNTSQLDGDYTAKVLGDMLTVSPLYVPVMLVKPFFDNSTAKEKEQSKVALALFPISIPLLMVASTITGLGINFIYTLKKSIIFPLKFLEFMADHRLELSWTSPFEYLYTSIIGSNDEGYCHEPLHFFD